MKVKTHYQERITGFVITSNGFAILGTIILLYCSFFKSYDENTLFLVWVMFVCTISITRCLAYIADAIHDSLHERINLQSSWLHTRLQALETEKGKGQKQWLYEAVPSDDTSHYFYEFPERITAKDQDKIFEFDQQKE